MTVCNTNRLNLFMVIVGLRSENHMKVHKMWQAVGKSRFNVTVGDTSRHQRVLKIKYVLKITYIMCCGMIPCGVIDCTKVSTEHRAPIFRVDSHSTLEVERKFCKQTY